MSEVLGMDELLKNLKSLPEKVQKRILVGAVRAGAKPMIKEAKSLAPVQSGMIKDSIGVTRFKTRKKSLVWFVVSPRVKTFKMKATNMDNGQNAVLTMRNDPWYAHFVEYGTYSHLDHPMVRARTGKLGKKRAKIVASGGGIKPHPFMRPAFEKEGLNSINEVRKYIAKRLDKELAK